MEFKTTKLNHTKLPISEILKKSLIFYNSIKKRRSVRDFEDEKIDLKIIENAILSAGSAPNGANLQPWHFVIINYKKIKKKIKNEAEKEEVNFYKTKASKEWLKALKPLGTDSNKKFLEIAPVLIAIFEKKYSIKNNKKIKNYYVRESVGIATGILISCLHISGLCMLTHTPSPMNFLNKILSRPSNEKPFLLLVVGYPKKNAKVPLFAQNKKKLIDICSIF
jgi:iodotyrosine deiodinase